MMPVSTVLMRIHGRGGAAFHAGLCACGPGEGSGAGCWTARCAAANTDLGPINGGRRTAAWAFLFASCNTCVSANIEELDEMHDAWEWRKLTWRCCCRSFCNLYDIRSDLCAAHLKGLINGSRRSYG